MDELLARVERLEQRRIAVEDLPITPLQRRLERTWLPDAERLLQERSVTSACLAAPEVYLPTLANGWAAQAGFRAPRVTRMGSTLTIEAVLNGAAAVAVTAFTLPAGWRPAAIVAAPVNYWSGAARIVGSCYVQASGAVDVLGNADALAALTNYIINMEFTL